MSTSNTTWAIITVAVIAGVAFAVLAYTGSTGDISAYKPDTETTAPVQDTPADNSQTPTDAQP